MMGIRGDHERLRLHGQQVILTHQPRHALVVDQHAAAPQLLADTTVAIAAPVLGEDLLNRRPHFHFFFYGFVLLQGPVQTGSADSRQLTHPLDTQFALHRHQLPDLVVDAVSPVCLPRWRRASTFCKAPLKKSASSVLSATSRFNCATCSRSSRSLPFSGGRSPSSIASNRSRHLYNTRRCTPSSSASAPMFSQPFSRSTAIFRNALGYFPTRRFATRSSFPCKLCQFRVSQFWGSLHLGDGWMLFLSLLRGDQEPHNLRLSPSLLVG